MDDRESVPESGEQKAASDAPVVTPNAATPPLKTEVVPVKVQDTNVPLHCFAVALRQRISQEQSKPYRLAGRLLLQVGVPLSLAIIATIYAAPTMTAQIDVFFGDLVKLASLGIVAVHTILAMTDIQGRGISTRYYMIISIYLLVGAMLLRSF
jgi:hypothetical protein